MQKFKPWVGNVAGAAHDGSQAEDSLKQTGIEGDLLNFVHVAVIFLMVQETFIDSQDFRFDCIGGEGQGQSEENPSFFLFKFHTYFSFP